MNSPTKSRPKAAKKHYADQYIRSAPIAKPSRVERKPRRGWLRGARR